MKNLTENQQSIINVLTNEFININQSRVLHKSVGNPLLAYSNEVHDIRDTEEEERDIIIAKNNAIRLSRKDKIREDYNYLVDLLEEVAPSICIKKRDFDIVISVENIYLYINYQLTKLNETKFIYYDNVVMFSETIILTFKEKEYDNIIDLINSDAFAKSFKQLINRAIQ
jgi:hypothetical protein